MPLSVVFEKKNGRKKITVKRMKFTTNKNSRGEKSYCDLFICGLTASLLLGVFCRELAAFVVLRKARQSAIKALNRTEWPRAQVPLYSVQSSSSLSHTHTHKFHPKENLWKQDVSFRESVILKMHSRILEGTSQ